MMMILNSKHNSHFSTMVVPGDDLGDLGVALNQWVRHHQWCRRRAVLLLPLNQGNLKFEHSSTYRGLSCKAAQKLGRKQGSEVE